MDVKKHRFLMLEMLDCNLTMLRYIYLVQSGVLCDPTQDFLCRRVLLYM